MIDKWIAIDDCKDGGFYEIDARNFSYGVYSKKKQGFYGVRHKFNYVFLELEDHWDTGAPYGTVKPIAFIKDCPISLDKEDELFKWLQNEIKDKE